MKKIILFIAFGIAITTTIFYFTIDTPITEQPKKIKMENTEPTTNSKVDFDAFEKLTKEVREYRKDRLLNLELYLKTAEEEDVIILDTRSESMFKAKHLKGAVNLNFSDFTQDNLAKVIPSVDTKILIYCNNNFDNDEVYFATKEAQPITVKSEKELTLALNIPTFINLYGYGYKNIYELSELISVFDARIEFEGTSVNVKNRN